MDMGQPAVEFHTDFKPLILSLEPGVIVYLVHITS